MIGGAIYHKGAVADVVHPDHARVLVERGHAEKTDKNAPETPGGKVEAPKSIITPPGTSVPEVSTETETETPPTETEGDGKGKGKGKNKKDE